jgi:hypothetical protein
MRITRVDGKAPGTFRPKEEPETVSGPSISKVAALHDGARAANALAFVEHQIGELSAAVDNEALAKHRAGTLTPLEAHGLWMEKFAYKRVIEKLNQTVRVGARSAQEIGPIGQGEE